MKVEKRFNIDFFELAFLTETCIPPRPIARMCFWDEMIDSYYHELTEEERKHLFEWISRNPAFIDGLGKKNSDCLLFEARYNPKKQYFVMTKKDGRLETYKAFKFNGQFHTKKNTTILKEFIIDTQKIYLNEN